MTIICTDEDGNGNILSTTTDNGDGTKTVRTFDAKGNETTVETVRIEGWTPPEPEPLSDAEKIADLEATVAHLLDKLADGTDPATAAADVKQATAERTPVDRLSVLTPEGKQP